MFIKPSLYACAAVDDPQIVMTAAVMTMGMTVVLTIFALTSKFDLAFSIGILYENLFNVFTKIIFIS